MTRSEDPPGNVKHLRFGRPGVSTDGTLELLKDFPGIKCIVLHTHGKRGEHPHYHVWWEGEKAVTNQTIRDRLKAIAHFKVFSGQNDWSFRNHDSWESWAAYVCDNMSHKVLLEYRDIVTVSESKAMVPIAIGPLHSNPPPAIIVKKTTMRDKFVFHLEKVHGWVRSERNPTKHEVYKQLGRFYAGAFNNNDAIRCIRHACYVFSDFDHAEQFLMDWSPDILKYC